MAKVLIIDDEQAICDFLVELVQQVGHQAVSATSKERALYYASQEIFDIILLDMYLPDGNGLELLTTFRSLPHCPEVLIMTGLGDPDCAELALRRGAWNYIQKPLSPKAIILPLKQILEYRDQRRSLSLKIESLKRKGLIGHSAAFQYCLEQLASAAQSQAGVLITGETGTGKELFARCLHENSPRAEQAFVVVDCTNIPENLMESMLFGHEKGAFTGADQRQTGLVSAAHKGTLFLDEIGDMPLSLQKKLLRILQEKRFCKLGSHVEEHSDFRIIAATNRNLLDMVEREEFREELLYRIQALSITLPPLRKRVEDIPELTDYFLTRLYATYGIAPKELAPECIAILQKYHWPGNVRQLGNVLEHTLANALDAPVLFGRHLPESVRIASLRSSFEPESAGGTLAMPVLAPPAALASPATTAATLGAQSATPAESSIDTYKDYRIKVLQELDKDYFTRVMEAAQGDLSQACRLSGLGRSRLYEMLRQCRIRPHKY